MTSISRVVGALIAYHPDLAALDQNIRIASAQVDKLYVWDNTGPGSLVGSLGFPENVVYLQREKNDGIAVPLNRMAQLARESGADWFLTLDQDSTLTADYVSGLLAIADCMPSLENVGIIAGSAIEPYKKPAHSTFEPAVVNTLITSGSLIRLSAYEHVGGSDEQMFIDCVDHELCLKMRRHGFALYSSNSVNFQHTIGEPQEVNLPFLGIKLRCSKHAPLRKYYSTRNRLKLYRNFFLFDPMFVLKDSYSMCAEIVKIILFEDRTFSKLRAIVLGVMDAIAGRGGSCRHQI